MVPHAVAFIGKAAVKFYAFILFTFGTLSTFNNALLPRSPRLSVVLCLATNDFNCWQLFTIKTVRSLFWF